MKGRYAALGSRVDGVETDGSHDGGGSHGDDSIGGEGCGSGGSAGVGSGGNHNKGLQQHEWTSGVAGDGLPKNTAADPEVSIQKEGSLKFFGLAAQVQLFSYHFYPNLLVSQPVSQARVSTTNLTRPHLGLT